MALGVGTASSLDERSAAGVCPLGVTLDIAISRLDGLGALESRATRPSL
jgi:hypothetical protein